MTDPYYPRDRNWHPAAYYPDYKSSIYRSPTKPLIKAPQSPSEDTGPVFGHDMLGDLDNDLIRNFAGPGAMAIGPRLIVHGRVLDENARPVPGALIEIWQANAGGRYRHAKEGYLAPLDPHFGGCGRAITLVTNTVRGQICRHGQHFKTFEDLTTASAVDKRKL